MKRGSKKQNTVELHNIPISDLLFDPENPRLPSNLHYTEESEIFKWMLQDATLIELMASIGSAGYFQAEPLLVIPSEKDAEKYIVIEGNRRLASIKLLDDPSLAPIKKKAVKQVAETSEKETKEIPCVIYNERNDILDYLGYRHITGIKEWSSLAKANYMSQLYDAYFEKEGDQIYKKIARLIGSRADYVKKLLHGLWIFEEIVEGGFFNIKSLNEDTIDFSLLTTAIGYTGLKVFLNIDSIPSSQIIEKEQLCKNLDTAHLAELTTWLFKETDEGSTRVGESRNLKSLNKIVQNQPALEAFRDGQRLERAAMLTSIPLENLTMYLTEARSNIELANDLLKVIDNPEKNHLKLTKDVIRIARQLKGAIDEMFDDDDD